MPKIPDIKKRLNLPEPTDFIPQMVRAHNSMVNAFERICGIHLARWRLLFNIARNGTVSQSELTRSTTMAPAAVTRILADMERSGLILRAYSQRDNRQLLIQLTAAGEDLVVETAAKREVFLHRAMQGFSEAELALLGRLLGALDSNLSTER